MKNDNDKVEKDEKKSELENNISSNPGFGQFNLFENVNRPSKKEKLNVVYQYIESEMSAKLFLKKLEKQNNISYHLSTEIIGDSDSDLKSISFCWENNVSYVLKSNFKKFNELLKIFFENQKVSKISYDLKSDIKILDKKNIKILGNIFDVKLAHYLVNPDISHDLINLSNNYLNISAPLVIATAPVLETLTNPNFFKSFDILSISRLKAVI